MKDRIIEFLRTENKSSSLFAEEIGVQPSGISHILSGRNNPSLEFVLKMLNRYKYLSAEWLLFGKGPMYKDSTASPTLFDQDFVPKPAGETGIKHSEPVKTVEGTLDDDDAMTISGKSEQAGTKVKKSASAEKIVWFYSDGSFEEYFPR